MLLKESRVSLALRGLLRLLRPCACPALLILLTIGSGFPASATDDAQESIDRLVRDFAKAFNAVDYDTMASFYEKSSTAAFQARRTDADDRTLHETLQGILGTVQVQEVVRLDTGTVLALLGPEGADPVMEIRFQVEGEAPLINGFTVGKDPNADRGHAEKSAAPQSGHAKTRSTPEAGGPFAFLATAEGVHQSQVFIQADGSLLLVWVQKGPHEMDLYAARQGPDGAFGRPQRLNHRGVNRYTGDEARPDVALGPGGAVAVVWTGGTEDIMLAIGSEYGTTFTDPVKLNQDAGQAYRTMPSVALTSDGAAHVVWLDPRDAPKGKEEPSDLYYAQIKDGAVAEKNLTAQQESTVCGCCRPFIAVNSEGQLDIAFRNSSDAGYRDISRIVGNGDTFGQPRPTSPPIWKLGGCPMAGPVVSDKGTLWKDASTGSWRLLWATAADAAPEVLFADNEERVWTHSPRRVSGSDGWVLVGARPHTLILERDKASWKIVRDDLPAWVTSAAVSKGQLIMIGNEDGKLRTAFKKL